MSTSKRNQRQIITVELPPQSRLTKEMIHHLDNLLDYREPNELKNNLFIFFLQALSTYHYKEEDVQLFGSIAEDFYFLHEFLTGLEEEILKRGE